MERRYQYFDSGRFLFCCCLFALAFSGLLGEVSTCVASSLLLLFFVCLEEEGRQLLSLLNFHAPFHQRNHEAAVIFSIIGIQHRLLYLTLSFASCWREREKETIHRNTPLSPSACIPAKGGRH